MITFLISICVTVSCDYTKDGTRRSKLLITNSSITISSDLTGYEVLPVRSLRVVDPKEL